MTPQINTEARRNALQTLAAGRATLRYRFFSPVSKECCPVGAVVGEEVTQQIVAKGLNAACVKRVVRELDLNDTEQRFGFSVDELCALQGINDGSYDVIEGASGKGPEAVKQAAAALLAGMAVVAKPHDASKLQITVTPGL